MSCSPARKIAYALLPLALLLGVSELALWLGDSGGRSHDLSRGFNPQARYLLPDRDVPGGWRTQFYAGSRDEVIIAPRSGALRVLLYSGHNEFVERGFSVELDAGFGGPLQRYVAGVCSHLRTFNALAEGFAGSTSSTSPEIIDRGRSSLFGLSFDETRRYYEAYTKNLEDMCGLARAAGVPVVLCTVVPNMLSPPDVFAAANLLDAKRSAEYELRLREGSRLIPARFREGLIPALHLRPNGWFNGHAPANYVPPVLRGLNGLLEAVAATVGDRLASAEGAHWPDPQSWGEPVRAFLRPSSS